MTALQDDPYNLRSSVTEGPEPPEPQDSAPLLQDHVITDHVTSPAQYPECSPPPDQPPPTTFPVRIALGKRSESPVYTSVVKKPTDKPTLAQIAGSKTGAESPISDRSGCKPTPPSRSSSLKRSSRPGSLKTATSASLPRRSRDQLDQLSRSRDNSGSRDNTASNESLGVRYTTIPSYPSAGSLNSATLKAVPKALPLPTASQRSYTSSSQPSVDLSCIQGAPAMYGRHYRAFRDSRRSDRPTGIMYLKFNQQDFYELLDECDSKRRHFNDRSFPPDISSICYIPFRNMSDIVAAAEGKVCSGKASTSSRTSSRLSNKDGERSPRLGHIVWKRPKELNPRSRLLSGGKMFRGDLVEGVRGSAHFGAACSALALKHELLFQVMPDDQCPIAFEDDWGIYKFRFWRYGNWTEVTIDDKLPSVGGELLYTHTTENDEHWMCVMEKAYAKFNGCYDIINKIPLSDMLQHLTGGITETVELKTTETPERLGFYLENCFKKRALILTKALKSKEGLMLGLENELPYIVTRVKRRTRLHPCLVCLYSPFGSAGWAGPWGRESPEWRDYSHDDIYNFGLMNESEFDFWISVEDLVLFFETVYIAHQSSDTMAGIVQQLDPSIVSLVRSGVYGNWIINKTDGGAPNNTKFLTHNVQYLITQPSSEDKMCVVSLVQRFRPRNTPHEGFMCIGFSVFKAPENIQYRMTDLKDAPVAIATYSHKESVSIKVNLEPGNYVVIPTTYQPGVVGEYLLRCVSARNIDIRALKQAPPSVTKKQVVDVELICGENLPDLSHTYDAEPDQEIYCVILCGKEKCQVPVKQGSNPTWDCIATFHAKSPYKKTILVQVWYKPGQSVDVKEDICLAETCNLPIITGDHKVVSQLTFAKKPANKSSSLITKSKKNSRCAGSISLIIRYNPLPNIFRGIPKGVQAVSQEQSDRRCRTEPRGAAPPRGSPRGATLPPRGSPRGATLPPRGSPLAATTLPQQNGGGSVSSIPRPSFGSSTHLEQIFMPQATLNREQRNRNNNSPARRRHFTDEDQAINRPGVINNITDLSVSRPNNDDIFSERDPRGIKLNVNSDKTLSPEQSLRVSSDHSLTRGLIVTSTSDNTDPLPPYQDSPNWNTDNYENVSKDGINHRSHNGHGSGRQIYREPS